ncbi:MAG: hypothetical protein ACXAC7_03350 [Candidatus Hodarchaeales archaeon]|jgi:hypothetical protein
MFRDRKVKKFAKEIEERDNSIFVFGSNIQTKQFIEDLIRLGLGNKVALIADDEKDWVDDLQEEKTISVLIEDNLVKYGEHKLYNLIGFNTAEKIIILHSDSQLIQQIISHIEDLGERQVNIILIAQDAPAFVHYLSQAQRDRFIITDNVYAITAELFRTMGLDLVQPPVITVPVPKGMISKKGEDLTFEKSRVLRIQRKIEKNEELIQPTNLLIEGDLIMLYLFEGEESIKEIMSKFQAMSSNSNHK